MANLLKGGCVTQVSIMQNVRDPLRLHLNQENVKSAKKWLSYGSLPMGGCVVSGSDQYHIVCGRSFRASIEPKRSKIGQDTAEVWPIYQREVA